MQLVQNKSLPISSFFAHVTIYQSVLIFVINHSGFDLNDVKIVSLLVFCIFCQSNIMDRTANILEKILQFEF